MTHVGWSPFINDTCWIWPYKERAKLLESKWKKLIFVCLVIGACYAITLSSTTKTFSILIVILLASTSASIYKCRFL